MTQPLMPKATAVWLVENTVLTFEQIGEFCGLHELEVQAIADGEVAGGMPGIDPIVNSQLTQEELDRCQADPDSRLVLAKQTLPQPQAKPKGPRYTPIAKRADKPDAIIYLLKNHPELGDAQITKLIGTTKPTIAAVRDRSHWNSPNIRPRSPLELGLCSTEDMAAALDRASRRSKPSETQLAGQVAESSGGPNVSAVPLPDND